MLLVLAPMRRCGPTPVTRPASTVCLVRDLSYPPIVAALKVAFRLWGLDIATSGTHHVPREGGAVLAVNHISYVDFIFGGLATQDSDRLVRFMAKKELFDHRWVGPLMRSLHHIEVDRASGMASYRQALRYLKAGEVVGVFPEATISRSMELKELKTGTVRMAATAKVPLVPCVLWGTQRIMTKDHARDFSRGHALSISVGEPLHPAGKDAVGQTRQLHDAMSTLLDRAIRTYPESPQGQWWAPASYGGTAPTPAGADRLDAREQRARAARSAARSAAHSTRDA